MPPRLRSVEEMAAIARDMECKSWILVQVYLCCTGNCEGGLALLDHSCMDRWHVCIVDCTELTLENGGEGV